MPSIAIKQFSGEQPRLGKQLLPTGAADSAINIETLSGELRPLKQTNLVTSLASAAASAGVGTIKRAWQLYAADGSTFWAFTGEETADITRSPLINDSLRRVYFSTDGNAPQYVSEVDLQADPSAGTGVLLLGIPAPTSDLGIGSVTGGTGPVVTRSYVYTLVGSDGSEGPPCAPTTFTGNDDGTWNLNSLDTTSPANRGVTDIRIYRTVTSVIGTTNYHFVAEVGIGSATYPDGLSTAEVSLRDTINSTLFDPPPSDLLGISSHPSGFLFGFRKNTSEVCMSEPYRPHAWPVTYRYSVGYDIVGLGFFGNSIVACTTAGPVILSGNRPEAVSISKVLSAEPCQSRRGIVSMPFGVLFPSPNGIIVVTNGGVGNYTGTLMTKEEWQGRYSLTTLTMVKDEDQIIGFDADNTAPAGFSISVKPNTPELGSGADFVTLDDLWSFDGILTDDYSGDVIFLDRNIVRQWNPAAGLPTIYSWKSKEFEFDRPVNLSCIAIDSYERGDLDVSDLVELTTFNTERFAAAAAAPGGMDSIGSRAIGGWTDFEQVAADNALPWTTTVSQTKLPMGYAGQYQIAEILESDPQLTLEVYADEILQGTYTVDSDEPFRLATGFKARTWQFRLIGNKAVKSLKVATTMAELARI